MAAVSRLELARWGEYKALRDRRIYQQKRVDTITRLYVKARLSPHPNRKRRLLPLKRAMVGLCETLEKLKERECHFLGINGSSETMLTLLGKARRRHKAASDAVVSFGNDCSRLLRASAPRLDPRTGLLHCPRPVVEEADVFNKFYGAILAKNHTAEQVKLFTDDLVVYEPRHMRAHT
jgi:hypothetical protein